MVRVLQNLHVILLVLRICDTSIFTGKLKLEGSIERAFRVLRYTEIRQSSIGHTLWVDLGISGRCRV